MLQFKQWKEDEEWCQHFKQCLLLQGLQQTKMERVEVTCVPVTNLSLSLSVLKGGEDFGRRGVCHQSTEDCGIKMKWLVGSRDSKAAETQTDWPRALSTKELSSPKSYHKPRPAWKKMPQCTLPAQAKFRHLTLSGLAGEEGWRHRALLRPVLPQYQCYTGTTNSCRNVGQPSLHGSRIVLSVSSFPYPRGRCGPHLLLFAGCKEVEECLKPSLPLHLQGIVPPLRW